MNDPGRLISLRFSFLDAQVLDAEALPLGRADDVEVAVDGGEPRVEFLLVGSRALGDRIGGNVGRWMAGISRRLSEERGADSVARVPVGLITGTIPMISLAAPLRDLPQLAGLERWLARNFVERLPGAGHAAE